MKFYSSTFLSIILSFLFFLSSGGKTIDVIQNPEVPNFTYIFEEESNVEYDGIQIEIFDELNCKNCTEFVLNNFEKIKNLEKETDEIKLHIYFVPKLNIEINQQAALGLKCAADQEVYFEMHDKFHTFKEDLSKQALVQFSKELEINSEAFDECIKEKVYLKEIQEDQEYAAEQGISVKPTIRINQYKLVGNQPFENIQRIINEILEEGKKPQAPIEPEVPTDLENELEFGSGIEIPKEIEPLEINQPQQ